MMRMKKSNNPLDDSSAALRFLITVLSIEFTNKKLLYLILNW